MPKLSRLEIVETTLNYLENGNVNKAIEYLKQVKEKLIKESEKSVKREKQKKLLIERCIEILHAYGIEVKLPEEVKKNK